MEERVFLHLKLLYSLSLRAATEPQLLACRSHHVYFLNEKHEVNRVRYLFNPRDKKYSFGGGNVPSFWVTSGSDSCNAFMISIDWSSVKFFPNVTVRQPILHRRPDGLPSWPSRHSYSRQSWISNSRVRSQP